MVTRKTILCWKGIHFVHTSMIELKRKSIPKKKLRKRTTTPTKQIALGSMEQTVEVLHTNRSVV